MPFSKKGKDQEHDANQRESNRNRHERGASRKQADQARSTNPNTQRGLAKPNEHVTICSLSVQAGFDLSTYGEGRSD